MGGKKYVKSKKKSSVKSRKKVQRTNLTNEELLDNILKKKKRNNVRKKIENDLPLLNEQYAVNRLKEVNSRLKKKSISSDEIYDLLQERKRLNKEINRIKKEKSEEPDLEKTLVNLQVEDVILEVPKKEDKLEEIKTKKLEDTQVLLLDDTSKKNRILVICVIVLSIVFVGILIGASIYYKTDRLPSDSLQKERINDVDTEVEDDTSSKEAELLEQYNKCLNRPVFEAERTPEIVSFEEEVINYLKKYRVSVGYNDLTNGYTFNYNENQIYYAASTAKVIAVLYLYNEASKGTINLDTTIKYLSRDKWGASPIMSKKKLGGSFTLRELCKYSITVSDNTAYQMLVRYIGRNKIVAFGKGLGARHTLSGGDNFGNINVSDALIYMKAINDFINTNEELGQELKAYMISADQNGLSLDEHGIQAAHKYGEYSPFYHDFGIVYSTHPYLVAILTREYGKNMVSTVKSINSKIYELHLMYYQNREKVCHLEIYGS